MNPHCRIGKITPKNGGATVRLFQSRKTLESDLIAADMLEQARTCLDAQKGNVVGYAILVMGSKMSDSGAMFVGEHASIPVSQLPDYLQSSFRRRQGIKDIAETLSNIGR